MIKNKIVLIFILSALTFLQVFSEEKLDIDKNLVKIDIDKALILAVANDKELKISKATIKIKDRNFYYELRKFLPTLNFGYSNSNEVAINGPDKRSTTLSIGLDFLVFDGGKLIFNTFLNKMGIELEKREILMKISEVITNTTNEYYSLILLYQKAAQQKELLDMGVIQGDQAELEYSIGTISELDYYDIGFKVKQIEIDLQKAVREKNDALRNFKYKLGLENVNIDLEKAANYELLDLTDDDFFALQNVALTNRLDVPKGYQTILNDKVNFAYTVASFLPNLNVGFVFSLMDEEFPPRRKSWGINFTLNFPLPYLPLNYSPKIGGSPSNTERKIGEETKTEVGQNITYENDIAKAKIQLTTDSIKHKELLREIRYQIKKEVDDYIDLAKIYKLKLLQNELAMKKLNVMRLKLEIGEVKRVELLEEEINYNNNKLEEKNILFQLINKESSIKQVLGIMGKDVNLREIINSNRMKYLKKVN